MRRKLLYGLHLILLVVLVSIFTFHTYSSEPKIDQAVREKIAAGSEDLEILIYMQEQADPKETALKAKEMLPENAAPQELKIKTREEVAGFLQKKAAASQEAITKKLNTEMRAGQVTEYESFYVVNMIYARVTPKVVEDLARRSDVKYIYDNTSLELELPPADKNFNPLSTEDIPWNIARINAPAVWSEKGIDGCGTVIAVIDTGVNYRHPALEKNFRGYDPLEPEIDYNWYDPIYGRSEPDDVHGHGTTVAGVAVGKDRESKKFIGVAPGASWFTVRGINDNGWTDKASLIKAGQFILAPTDRDGENPKPELAPDIVVNSWGGAMGVDDWYKDMIANWRSAFIFPVFAAGNSGPNDETINNPGNYPSSFAVGAIDDQDELASFSSRGPGDYGDMIKPELVAPGVNIYTSGSENYVFANGTSMATPHVAGVAALIMESSPELGLEKIEEILKESALALSDDDYPGSPNYGYGYGLVEAREAVEKALQNMVLTVDIKGLGKVDPPPGTYYCKPGEKIELNAEARTGWVIEHWIIDGSTEHEEKSIVLTMDQNRTVKAVFVENDNYKDWVTLDRPQDAVSLEEKWLVTFTRDFEASEIDGIIIEKDEKLTAVDIELFPESNQVIIKPLEPYLPGETYIMRIYLNNLNRYIMYFDTLESEE